MKDKISVITGASGFAGFSLTKAMVDHGYKVYAVVRPGSNHNKRLEKLSVNIVEIDGHNYDRIPNYIQEKCDLFFHLSWTGNRDDFKEQIKNVDFSLKALESAKKIGCSKFIATGSQAEYGVCNDVIFEDNQTWPINSYGAVKVSAMYLTKRRAEQLDIDWIWGRIFSLYGKYEPSGRLFSDLLEKLMADENMKLSSCKQYWDYLNVEDAAEALIALAENGSSGNVYNIANGDYRELKWYVEEMKNIVSSHSVIYYGDDPEPYISLKPSTDKILNDTGWKPRISFIDGVNKQIEFLEKTASRE